MGYGNEFHDLSPIVANPANFCLLTEGEDGGYIIARLSEGLYVAHTLALPQARGKPMLRLMREGFEWLFTATDALEITTLIPDGNDAADRWAGIAGFRETFRREAFFPLRETLVGGSFRALTYGEWVTQHPMNRLEGEHFHHRLHAVSDQLAIHADDPVHDAWVGATVKAIRAGNLEKAIRQFNRWAVQAGYRPSVIRSTNPPVIDTGDAILGMHDGDVVVLGVTVAKPDALR